MMFAETLLLSETRTGPIIDSFEKDYFFRKIKGRYNSLQLPFTVLINLLKTKRRLLYLKAQSLPRCKHFSSRL